MKGRRHDVEQVEDRHDRSDAVASLDALDNGVRGGPDPERIDTNLFTNTIPDGATSPTVPVRVLSGRGDNT
jgi:hypothetical protein